MADLIKRGRFLALQWTSSHVYIPKNERTEDLGSKRGSNANHYLIFDNPLNLKEKALEISELFVLMLFTAIGRFRLTTGLDYLPQ